MQPKRVRCKWTINVGLRDNNGNVERQTISFTGLNAAQSYTYDSLNRLKSMSEVGGWSQTYSYDRYGNRWVSAGSIPSPQQTPQSQTSFSAMTNRINPSVMTGFAYDAVGNLTSDPTTPANGIVYDSENRQTSYTKSGLGTTSYSYDGDGRRVKKVTGGVTTIYVYDVMGRLVAEYTDSQQQPAGGTKYLTADHLGSTRVVTSQNQSVVARYDYLPFGEEIGAGVGSRTVQMGYGASDTTKQKFTSKERDGESGLDYFLARYYSSAQGRFLSIDPENAGATKKDPQSWNAYQYGRNNPLIYVDPDGLKVRVYDENGNYHDLSDEEANNSIFNKQYIKSIGFTVNDGNIFDDKGKLVGTYTRISFDDFSDKQNAIIFGVAARAKAMNQAIAAFGIGTAFIGVTGGAAAFLGEVTIGGSSLTTLEIGQVSGTAAVETGAAASTASTAFGRTVQNLKEFLQTGNGIWQRVSAHVEQAESYRNATSIEEVFINRQTGERIIRHLIVRGERILHETFRTYSKFGRK